jgi:hypothetical protein
VEGDAGVGGGRCWCCCGVDAVGRGGVVFVGVGLEGLEEGGDDVVVVTVAGGGVGLWGGGFLVAVLIWLALRSSRVNGWLAEWLRC